MARKSGFTFNSNKKEYEKLMAIAIEKSLETIGLVAEGKAVKLAPVDTGLMRQGIGHKVKSDRVILGVAAEYSIYVEFGTFSQQAQPFLRPAIQNYKKEYMMVVKKFLKEAFDD